jgi:TonB family protein
MTRGRPLNTVLEIPLLEERYGRTFVGSLGLHIVAGGLFLFAPYLLPVQLPLVIGTGPGGGVGGASYTVGVVDDLGGGAGMTKPALVPVPPALPADKPAPEEVKEAAVPLPNTVEPKKPPKQEPAPQPAKKEAPAAKSNVIPTAPQPGAGGQGGVTGGSGGGRGGGAGISIGSGSGGLGDSYYARAVEARVSSNWVRPELPGRIEIVYSFVIAPSGIITEVKREKSSGNDLLDLTAERAIRASSPLPKPPPEFGGRAIQFMAQFVHPPNPQ